MLARDGYACACCGTSVIGRFYTVAYRLPPGQGGGNSPANLLTLLGSRINPYGDPGNHHRRIESRCEPEDAARGLSLLPGQDPALVPVAYWAPHGLAAFYLTESGSRTIALPAGR